MADDATQAPVVDNPAEIVTTPPVDTAAKPVETVLTAPDPVTTVAQDWADDWREKMAGGDEKELARLARFKSPVDVYKSARELEKKMSSGAVKAKLADDATPEQLSAWRKDNGIPDAPEGYLEKLPKGLVIGEADKPLVEGFLARVHGKNADPAIVGEALDWYYGAQEEAIAAQSKADATYRAASTDALRQEWGGEFRANLNSITAFLDAAPALDDGTPLKPLLMDARLGDGTRLGDNPAALKWLAQLANEANPAGFISPGGSGTQGVDIDARLDAIRKTMRENRNAYDRDEKMQLEYQKLLTFKQRNESR